MKKYILLFIALCYFSCGNSQKDSKNKGKTEITNKDKQLNVTFLLDLSDRIEPTNYPNKPEHYERDIAIVNEFVAIFKKQMQSLGVKKAKGKIRVLFSPTPQDDSINQIASELNINLADLQDDKKKKIYKEIQEIYPKNLNAIYERTLESKNYIGSDIWQFFKEDVRNFSVENDPIYRNILVVITDGYIYHEDTKFKEGNRMSYILPQTAKSLGLTKSDWKEKMDKMDFGLIAPCKDLDNLEVLVLEVNPTKNNPPYEGDILKEVLKKWFHEMGVKHFEIYKTDIPDKTKTNIQTFLGRYENETTER